MVKSADPVMLASFPAFIAEERDGGVDGRVSALTVDRLPAGDVLIDVEYSSLNFKDALAATGQNKVASAYPHVPGIDAAGTVAESSVAAWKPGDRVLVHRLRLRGRDASAATRAIARVPADWVVRIPDSLSTLDAMAIGTAGYTAALCLLALQRNGTKPRQWSHRRDGRHGRRRLRGGRSLRRRRAMRSWRAPGKPRAARLAARARRGDDRHARRGGVSRPSASRGR